MKSVNVGILNTTSTTTTTGMGTSPGQTAVPAGGLTKDKLPCMLKLLTGACVVQGICLIATAATLGCYVNENIKAIETLNHRTEQLSKCDDAVEIQNTKIERLEAAFPTETSKLALLENKVQNQTLRIDNLEIILATNVINIKHNQSDSLSLFDSDISKYGDRIGKLESEYSNIQNNSIKIDKLESKVNSATNDIQKTNSTVTVTDLSKRIVDLELEFESVSNNSKMIPELGDLGQRMVILEKNALDTQNNSDRIRELELNDRLFTAIMPDNNDLEKRIADLENKTVNNSNAISELEFSTRSAMDIMMEHNDTLADLGKWIHEQGAITTSIRNNYSYIIIDLDAELKTFASEYQKYNTTLTDLENRLNALEANVSVKDSNEITELNTTLTDLGSRLNALEANVSVKNSNEITELNTTITDLGSRLNALEANVSVKNSNEITELDASIKSVISVLQDYNFTLIDLNKRIVELDTNASSNSDKITELESNIDSATLDIQTNDAFLNALSDKITDLQSQTSSIKNNSDIIREIDSDLEFITSVIEDHGVILQDVENKIITVEADAAELKKTVYIRWGRTTCPGNGSESVYNGFAGGSHFEYRGGAASMLCLPPDPDWDGGKYDDTFNPLIGLIYGTEYQDTEGRSDGLFAESHYQEDAPCVVCLARRQSVLMIPGKSKCYDGWTFEYSGFLMADHYNYTGATDYYCVDKDPENLPYGGSNQNGYLLYFVEARCGSLPCPPYVNGREFQCVVCTK